MSASPTTAPTAANSRDTRQFAAVFLVLLALLIVAPFVAYPFFVMQALCFALYACAFNLLIGYVGLLSFGHAMFLGAASYVCAHAAKVWGFDPVLAILAGVACSAALGLIAGVLSIRSHGIYFAMITVALSQMIFFICVEAPFTHGEDGIQGVPQGRAFGLIDLSQTGPLYIFVAAIFLFGFLAVYRTVNSPFGEVLKAIRENEPRAISLGYRVARYKLAAFVLSAALGGPCRRDQGACAAERLADRCLLRDVWRGGADDAAGRHGHALWPGGRRGGGRLDGELSRPVWRMGDGDPGRRLRRLRAAVPARHRRRNRQRAEMDVALSLKPSPIAQACAGRTRRRPLPRESTPVRRR